MRPLRAHTGNQEEDEDRISAYEPVVMVMKRRPTKIITRWRNYRVI